MICKWLDNLFRSRRVCDYICLTLKTPLVLVELMHCETEFINMHMKHIQCGKKLCPSAKDRKKILSVCPAMLESQECVLPVSSPPASFAAFPLIYNAVATNLPASVLELSPVQHSILKDHLEISHICLSSTSTQQEEYFLHPKLCVHLQAQQPNTNGTTRRNDSQ